MDISNPISITARGCEAQEVAGTRVSTTMVHCLSSVVPFVSDKAPSLSLSLPPAPNIKRSPPDNEREGRSRYVECTLMAAQAMASIGAVNGSLHLRRVPAGRSGIFSVKAQQQPQQQISDEVHASSRRAVLGLVATTLVGGSLAPAVLAINDPIKIGPPPPQSGGLPGTLNSDEARDLDLKYKDRFYLQPKSVEGAVARAKESLKEIESVKSSIDKKAWPYVMNDLRLRATYLRYDLNTIISGKPKSEKKDLKELSQALFTSMDNLDHAAKVKSSEDAQKYYAATISALNNVLAKLG